MAALCALAAANSRLLKMTAMTRVRTAQTINQKPMLGSFHVRVGKERRGAAPGMSKELPQPKGIAVTVIVATRDLAFPGLDDY